MNEITQKSEEERIREIDEERLVQLILVNDKDYFIPIDLANHLTKVLMEEIIEPLKKEQETATKSFTDTIGSWVNKCNELQTRIQELERISLQVNKPNL